MMLEENDFFKRDCTKMISRENHTNSQETLQIPKNFQLSTLKENF
jgi:hypothetical protein